MGSADQTFLQVMEDGSPKFVCARCGGWFAVSLPIEIGAYARMLRAFSSAHRRCEPAPAPEETQEPTRA